jgi:hypothetical protein
VVGASSSCKAVFAGRWDAEVIFPGHDKPVRGTASFRWLAKHGLMMRSRMAFQRESANYA